MTAHDGFTLHDLVSYDEKHNEANLENNRDGHSHNNSWNCGVEGDTDDPKIRALRLQQQRNFFATLLLSQGVPMLLAGDEFSRTQHGNNNAYCQDNELSWMEWTAIGEQERNLFDFLKQIVRLRREHIVFHRHRFFRGKAIPGTRVKDITWLRPDGEEMTHADWHNGETHWLSFLLSGEAGEYHLTPRGEQEPDDSFLAMLNAHHDGIPHALPTVGTDHKWELVFDTSRTEPWGKPQTFTPGQRYTLQPRSFVLMRCC